MYHLPSGFLSLGKEEPISECLDRRRSLAGLGHGGPTRRVRLSMSLHLVKIWFSLVSSLVHSRGVHSVTLIVCPCLWFRQCVQLSPCIHAFPSWWCHLVFTPVGCLDLMFAVLYLPPGNPFERDSSNRMLEDRIPLATVSKFEHFRSLHDAPVHSAVLMSTWLYRQCPGGGNVNKLFSRIIAAWVECFPEKVELVTECALSAKGSTRPVHPPYSSVFVTEFNPEYGNTDLLIWLRKRSSPKYGNAHHLNIFFTVISSCACVKNVAPSVGNVHVPLYYARCQATRYIP